MQEKLPGAARENSDTSEVSYSDEELKQEGAGSEDPDSAYLDRLSSSNWSARISTKLSFEVCHERIKAGIPMLDLNNLPADSSAEEDDEQEGNEELEMDDDGFVEQELASNCMSPDYVNAFHAVHGKDKVMDLFA